MNNIVKVENHPNLVKDMNSKAVLNANYAALLEYRKKQQSEQEIHLLKKDIDEIKLMLKKLISSTDK